MSILLAKRFLPALSTIVAGIILAGCGSGGDSQTGPIYPKGSAVLKDTTVAGITYVCSNETNVTTQEGRFFYDGQCAKVDFKIGGMKIGSIMVSDIHEDGKIYIAELLGLPRDATEDPRLKALLQLVQSLDKDHNPYNGIVVDPAKESALQNLQGNFVDLDSNTTKINDIEAAGISLTPKNHAVAHYEDTLRRDLGLDIDTVPPAPPVIQENLTEVYTDTTPITLYGEAHAHIRLDGNDTGLSIDENNTAILQLPTINIDDNNTFEILLVDDMNQESEPLVVSIYRPSIATLNARDVQEALNLIAQAGDPRAFNYTPQWNTGDPIQISFSESKRAPSVENQSYQVAVTFTKGGASETYTYTETVPFSQALRDAAEVANAKQLIAQAGDPRAFNYTPQWNTGDPIQISFSEPMRTPIGVDQNYEVTVTLGKGNSTEIYSFMEFVPSNNIKVDLPDGSIALLNENFDNPYRITNGGIFENEHNRSKFAGAAFALDASTLQNVESAQDLLTYLIDQSTFKSDFTGVSLRVGKDGSLVARYEIQNYNDNLYQLLQAMLSGINYEILDPIDFSQYSDVANVYVDFYIEYSTALNSYVIVAITDKTLNDDTEINNIVNKDSVVTANETLATETESFTYMNKSPLGDFIFVVDDSGSMSEEQEAAIDAIQQTFQASVHKYGIDWKATVIGTEEGRDYSASVSDFAENNLTKLVQQLDSLGTNGADEVGLKRVYEHLINGSIVTRENATLDIVYVSDEECHSQLNEIGLNDGNLDNSYFVQEGIRLNAVIPEDHSYEEGDLRSDDLAYRMAIATQGEIANLRNYETGYNRIMDAAIRHAAAATSDIQLQYPAIASSITVYVNDLLAEHWEYDPNENSIVFLSGFEPQNGETVKVVYNHIDYQSLVDVVKGEFDALPNDQKRNYGYAGIEIVFDPTDPLPPLQNADQTYEVNVSFNAYGYEAHSSYMETIPALSFSIATIDDWNQTAPLVFESLNHGNSTSSELVLHMDSPATVDYSVSSESNYDYLEIFSNGTSIGQFSGSQNGSINIQTGDEIKFVYSKDGSASNGDDKAIIAIH